MASSTKNVHWFDIGNRLIPKDREYLLLKKRTNFLAVTLGEVVYVLLEPLSCHCFKGISRRLCRTCFDCLAVFTGVYALGKQFFSLVSEFPRIL